ncbi:MAG: Gfo/Idh/MocA family oxidoreductase [Armatimonadetes bacterium]|nr:Gfo/Idh/MocA family oxidoreductase [Armatimonadota bacterium]
MGQHHARVCSEDPRVKLVGLVDTNEVIAREVSKKCKTKYHLDYRKLFGQVDAVNIAVPTFLHYQITKDFLEQGVHVLLEKPMTKNLLEAENLIRIARSAGVLLAIGHIERFNPAVKDLRGLVTKPVFIDAHRMGPPTTRNLDVGVVLELMIHDLDIVLSVVKAPVKRVHALGLSVYSNYEDIAQAQLLFENGCLVGLSASRVSAEKVRGLEITQEDAFISLDYMAQNITLRRQVSGNFVFNPKACYRREVVEEQPLISKDEPLKLEIVNFLDSITGKGKPVVTGADGKNALDLALRIIDNMELVCSRENRLARELAMMP